MAFSKAPNRPWYYVAGRKDLTEKLIARKREKEAQREKKWSATSNYFERCSAQNKLFGQWEDQFEKREMKNLLAGHRNLHVRSRPPFDVDEEKSAPSGFDEKHLTELQTKVSKFVDRVAKLDEDKKQFRDREASYFSQMRAVDKSKEEFKVVAENWHLKECKIKRMRLARDRLRQKGFFVLEQLHFVKSFIEEWISISKNLPLAKAEEEHLSDYLVSALKFINAFISMNNKRNDEFVCLYHEEALELHDSYELKWEEEETMWLSSYVQVVKIIQSTLADKLNECLMRQEALLKEKEKVIESLLTCVSSSLPDSSSK